MPESPDSPYSPDLPDPPKRHPKSPGTGIRKFGTGTAYCRQNVGMFKIYNGYRYSIGTSTGTRSFHFSVGIEIGIEKFGTGHKSWNRYQSNLVLEKVLVLVLKNLVLEKYRYRFNILGTVTH